MLCFLSVLCCYSMCRCCFHSKAYLCGSHLFLSGGLTPLWLMKRFYWVTELSSFVCDLKYLVLHSLFLNTWGTIYCNELAGAHMCMHHFPLGEGIKTVHQCALGPILLTAKEDSPSAWLKGVCNFWSRRIRGLSLSLWGSGWLKHSDNHAIPR